MQGSAGLDCPTYASHRKAEAQEASAELCHVMLGWLPQAVMESKHGAPFAVPVSEDMVPGYHTVIQHPMDLGTIANNLKQRIYKALGELYAAFDSLGCCTSCCIHLLSHPKQAGSFPFAVMVPCLHTDESSIKHWDVACVILQGPTICRICRPSIWYLRICFPKLKKHVIP